MTGDFFSYGLNYIDDVYAADHKNPLIDSSWLTPFENLGDNSLIKKDDSIFANHHFEQNMTSLIRAYQQYGYQRVCFSQKLSNDSNDVFQLSYLEHGFQERHLDQKFSIDPKLGLGDQAFLKDIILQLERIYCQTVGVQFHPTSNAKMKDFIHAKMCQMQNLPPIDYQKVWKELYQAEAFETFLHKQFPGQKRFSIEGLETFIPMLNLSLETMSLLEIKEVFIGMAHRGRMTTLAQVLKKPYSNIFAEFSGAVEDGFSAEGGDVKYHLGWQENRKTSQGSIQLSLSFNPSHLEAVIGVVEGKVKSRQKNQNPLSVMPILIHGDASVAGQGVVYETLQLSHLKGYETYGTIHIVMNNHIGFTAEEIEGRSTPLCTDIGLAFEIPIFHVSAQDPDHCIAVMNLAIELRQKFHQDVFINLSGYRKYGHNEGDEPRYTQPLLYEQLKNRAPIATTYLQTKHVDATSLVWMEQVKEDFKNELEYALSKPPLVKTAPERRNSWLPISKPTSADLSYLIEKLTVVPFGFNLHAKLQKKLEEKKQAQLQPAAMCIDWAFAEELAFAAILSTGHSIRLSGQDSCRGTFSSRHAVWIDQQNEKKHIPLQSLAEKANTFSVYNSPLSEFSVLGFELGYSLLSQNELVIWESQFGDFANTAQVIIDQFLAGMEKKWKETANVTLFLPHGYEGQGPEHSSARLERFLQLSADECWNIVQCTTPAQFFHLLLEQTVASKPLIAFTPKSLLRHVACKSSLQEIAEESFQKILISCIGHPMKVIFCTGKIYYDLIAKKEPGIVIIRFEQLYPFPLEEIKEALSIYAEVKEWVWAQEEPQNMGAWNYACPLIEPLIKKSLKYVGRKASSSVATGSYSVHQQQQMKIIQEVFA